MAYDLKVKEWFIDKMEIIAREYNCFIDVTDNSRVDGAITADENGCVEVIVEEKLNESEKAILVRLATGSIVGSVKGWKCWIPKSVIY